ncbi:MAG: hypothetical protein IPJ66_18780 [Bacteroidetes bacterium]|nr:hypothetical protein [Bacteroidota bacterium]
MKKIILILAILYLQVLHLNAQNLIAVQNVGQSTFYSNIDSAITYAQAGDTIYFPGGNFNLGSYRYVIQKTLSYWSWA